MRRIGFRYNQQVNNAQYDNQSDHCENPRQADAKIFFGSGISNFFNKIILTCQGNRCNQSADSRSQNSMQVQVLPGQEQIRDPVFLEKSVFPADSDNLWQFHTDFRLHFQYNPET